MPTNENGRQRASVVGHQVGEESRRVGAPAAACIGRLKFGDEGRHHASLTAEAASPGAASRFSCLPTAPMIQGGDGSDGQDSFFESAIGILIALALARGGAGVTTGLQARGAHGADGEQSRNAVLVAGEFESPALHQVRVGPLAGSAPQGEAGTSTRRSSVRQSTANPSSRHGGSGRVAGSMPAAETSMGLRLCSREQLPQQSAPQRMKQPTAQSAGARPNGRAKADARDSRRDGTFSDQPVAISRSRGSQATRREGRGGLVGFITPVVPPPCVCRRTFPFLSSPRPALDAAAGAGGATTHLPGPSRAATEVAK